VKRNHLLAVMLVVVCPAALAAPAHDPSHQGHEGTDEVSGQLGVVHFPTSGSPKAQQQFLRGLLLLHSFEYPAARKSFQEAWRLDPGFAMAIWGEALTYNHALWGEQDTDAARAALAKLGATPEQRLAKAPTARERAYLAAVEKLYGSGEKPERDAHYSEALATLAHDYPTDLDARSLYALSLLSLSGSKRNVSIYMRAAAEAESVYEQDRHHPGALHYLIHAYDDPVHAPLGLRAARLYSKVAPAASHAQHMPSHIFFALGMWDDAIEVNIASLKVSRSQGEGGYHALLWLEYAYLQKNQRPEAEELLRSVAHDVATGATKENRLRLAFARATWLVETRGGAEAESQTPVDSTGVASIGYFAAWDFARGITAAANNDLGAARAALAALRVRRDVASSSSMNVAAAWYDATSASEVAQASAMADALDGSIQFYEGQHAAGIARVRQAIAETATLEFEYGPPWSVKPFDELLGELLLADGQRAPAADAFRQTLVNYPNRRLALAGLAATSAPMGASAPVAAKDLVGSWRLLGIEMEDASGIHADPFYGSGTTGMLIYDASGTICVQIAGGQRPHVDAPARRPGATGKAIVARSKLALLDSYYAYCGTWEFDAATATATHHVQTSLYSGEEGASYAQQLQIDGRHLVFTRTRTGAEGKIVQRKTWERVGA